MPIPADDRRLDVPYIAHPARYSQVTYQRPGDSGILLPRVSLGLWQNVGQSKSLDQQRAIIHRAFDRGITHFDLANNYGPPYGQAESSFGEIPRRDLASHRDDLLIATKAGYDMWPGPYGDDTSRKYLTVRWLSTRSSPSRVHRLGPAAELHREG